MAPKGQETKASEDSDQRYLPRWQVKNRILFQSEDYSSTQEGHTKDLSCTGVCFYTALNLNPRQKVRLTIYLSDQVSVKVNGEVIWVRPAQDLNQVGVIFYGVSQKSQDLILEHAFEIKPNEVSSKWFDGWDGKNNPPSSPI